MTTAIQDTPTVTQSDFVLGVIVSNGFRVGAEGWLYPAGDDPLVRVNVSGNRYFMERRRTPTSAWMGIVNTYVDEFDQAAFEQWVENWPLAA